MEEAHFCSACGERSPHNLMDLRTNQIFDHINMVCRSMNAPFVDDAFPPSENSILRMRPNAAEWSAGGDGGRGLELDGAGLRQFVRDNSVTWRRPAELDPSRRWCVFQGTVRPGDITQGRLGDCWLLSSLAVLAENPALVHRVLGKQELSPHGVYKVRLCHHGEWKSVIVDDLLPCQLPPQAPQMQSMLMMGMGRRAAAAPGQLVFGKGGLRGEQLWVPLIEKAIAKLHGSYASLSGGNMHEGFALLSGAPCELLRFGERADGQLRVDGGSSGSGAGGSTAHDESFNLLWAKILSYRDSGYLMGASCCAYPVTTGNENNAATKAAAEAMGLIANHAYSVIDVQITTQGRQMIRLLNPWGTPVWAGDWLTLLTELLLYCAWHCLLISFLPCWHFLLNSFLLC